MTTHEPDLSAWRALGALRGALACAHPRLSDDALEAAQQALLDVEEALEKADRATAGQPGAQHAWTADQAEVLQAAAEDAWDWLAQVEAEEPHGRMVPVFRRRAEVLASLASLARFHAGGEPPPAGGMGRAPGVLPPGHALTKALRAWRSAVTRRGSRGKPGPVTSRLLYELELALEADA